MPKSKIAIADHFKHRASAYRQLAVNANDDKTAGNMFELAAMFERITVQLRVVEFTSAQPQTFPTSISAPEKGFGLVKETLRTLVQNRPALGWPGLS